MKAFNPEKELNKIQKGNKNKVIFGIFLLLIILGISSSYALYQVRYSKRIIYTKVAPFSSKDINIAVFIDNKNVANFPKKEDGKVYDKIECDDNKDNHVKAYFDSDTWNLEVDTNDKAKCNVYFKTPEKYQDKSGANAPELYQGLIPVKYEDTNEDGIPEIIVADTTKEWYDYEKQEWANAVLIDNTKVAVDLSGNNNDGEIVGSPTITNEGLSFSTNNDGIFLGDMLKDLFKHSNTIQVKLKKNQAKKRDIVIGNWYQNIPRYVNYESTINDTHQIWYNTIGPTGGSFPASDFVTYTYIYDKENTQIRIYKDNELTYTSTDSVYSNYGGDYTSVYIGRDAVADSRTLNGTIEKVMVYNDILTTQEIQQNLSAASGKVGTGGVVEDNLHLYYDFKVPQTVDTTPGKVLNMDVISQMYVWIPRYKYQLFNSEFGFISERSVKIKFEHGIEKTGNVNCVTSETGKETCENAIDGNWYTHPAFTFGNTELPGIWVGKFETSGTTESLVVKPNTNAIVNLSVKDMFTSSRNIELKQAAKYTLDRNAIDTHVTKNMEWASVAFLSQSKYGRCTELEECSAIAVNETVYKSGYSDAKSPWNTENGMHASTTDNIYGIYDMVGGAWEKVMWNMVDSNGKFLPSLSEFTEDTKPNLKYYDVYEYGNAYNDIKRGHLGDAGREVMTTVNQNLWSNGLFSLLHDTATWGSRGGCSNVDEYKSIFQAGADTGKPLPYISFRVVLTAQDGNE